MQYRPLGRTGFDVSTISFGAWAIGGSWGAVSDDDSLHALHRFVDRGGNFIDTADVYGDGRSERLIARLKFERPRDTIIVATKAGRRLSPHEADGYTAENLTRFVERSLKNLNTPALDLLQLHCPPTPVYDRHEVFDALDDLTKQGKVRHYGVSVETVDEALTAIRWPNVKTVQIIFNLLRTKPAERFLPEAKRLNVGVLARVPLASGLLTGKLSKTTKYADDDHRNFNQFGDAFDPGETFSGLGGQLDDAFEAVEELRKLVPAGATLARFALRWILMNDGVTCAIPGAKNVDQVDSNMAAADLPPLSADAMAKCQAIYDRLIRKHVHAKW
jgi:aryl-alcohol dehydrogenase-like predicted oxidoreductase